MLTSTNLIHKESELLKVKDNYHLRQLLIIHKIIHWLHRTPINISSKISLNNKIHNKNTRTKNDIFLSANSYSYKNKIIESSSIKWNQLENNLKK